MTTDKKIQALKPGHSVEISRTANGRCVAERSGDGTTLRFVRFIGDSWEVFKSCKY